MPVAHWYTSMPDPVLTVAANSECRLNFRRYTDTSPQMQQPALLENILCMHLGGPKTVQRWCEGRMTVHDVDVQALTIMPALQTNRWMTHGPVDFSHIALDPGLIGRLALEEFDGDPGAVELRDLVGFRSPLIERLFHALAASAERPAVHGRLYPESLLVVLSVALLKEHSTLSGGGARRSAANGVAKGGLAEFRLRRVIDYMREHMSADISLAQLTEAAGLSRAQLFRGFKRSTGLSPNRYLTALRLERAKSLLDGACLSVAQIAIVVGLAPEARLATLFRVHFGIKPEQYRLLRG